MQDSLTFTFSKGYYDTGNVVDVPEGALIEPSRNVLFDMNGRLTSFKGFVSMFSNQEQEFGGNLAFSLDRDTVAFMGNHDTYATGNAIQAVGRSLWFVGNAGSSIRIFDTVTGQFKSLGGSYTLERLFIELEEGKNAVELVKFDQVSAVPGAIDSGLSYFNLESPDTHSFTNNTPVRIRLESELPSPLQENIVYYALNNYLVDSDIKKAVVDTQKFFLLEYYDELPSLIPVGLVGFPPENNQKVQVSEKLVAGDRVYISSNEIDKDLFVKYTVSSGPAKDLRPYIPYFIKEIFEEEFETEEGEELILTKATLCETWDKVLSVGGPTISFESLDDYAEPERDNVTDKVKILGGRVIDLTNSGNFLSIARKTSDSTKTVKFTADSTTELLTVQTGSTVPFTSSDAVTVAPTGKLPAGIDDDTLYFVRLLEEGGVTSNTKFRVAVSSTANPLTLTDAGEGEFIVDVNPFLTVTFSSETPSITNKTFSVPVKEGFTEQDVANAVRDELRKDSQISGAFSVTSFSGSIGSGIDIEDKIVRENSITVSIAAGNDVEAGVSETLEEGGEGQSFEFENSRPYFAKYGDNGWFNPVPVGLRELEDLDKPTITMTTQANRGREFAGLITGSRTVRIARKRYGAVSIASPPSNLVTPPETGASFLINIPVVDPDDSSREDNSWILYFTLGGFGSTSTHITFPIEISEAELDGSTEPRLKQYGNAKYKVVRQSASSYAGRVVEVEFLDNDLIPLSPFPDYFPAEPCKFIVKLGNSMCLIGTGDDGTGVDVSFPNNYEAYSPEWRDWLSEQPVSVATEPELGYFWIASANNTYVAAWTGVTEDSAPILIEKRSNLIGTIGPTATVSVGGMLYSLSRGLTPVRMSPQGESDIFYGARVQNFFLSKDSEGNQIFDDNTVLSWDGATNSVIFSCKNVSISYQIDTNLWSAPTYSDFDILHSFQMDGQVYMTSSEEMEEEDKFFTHSWNVGTTYDWNMTSSFSFGKYGNTLKDITKVDLMYSLPYIEPEDEENEEEVASINSLVVKSFKNFRNKAQGKMMATIPLTRTGSTISVRKYVENLDFNSVSLSVDGKIGGTTLHSLSCEIDVHTIERTSL